MEPPKLKPEIPAYYYYLVIFKIYFFTSNLPKFAIFSFFMQLQFAISEYIICFGMDSNAQRCLGTLLL